ncbi:transcriptional regulator, IclR family [Halobacillus dabanensis]|uniref:Glycerol operon regulatory protein n=1 Tax=Halobacillus dabanensis TaxID=240302 RepID=A0A1I3RMQ0_HALDA|nr:IclR family transcriptional regulator [Halobacillus dabanensis]SFJ47585.1 transcriptional regulator, IclR family [Halobacillus dabanensis]
MPIIQSVDRAFKILDLFNELNPELKVSEISSKLSLNKSTVHSLLKTLKEHDYVRQDPDSGKYSLGMKLVERSNFLMNSIDVRSIAKQSLVELSMETSLAVHLVILDGQAGVYIDKVDSPTAIIGYSRVGRRVPIHSSAVGKVLVAYQSQEERNETLKDYDYKKQTEKTITNAQDFQEELQRVLTKGYAIDAEENEPGVTCLAIPIYDHSGRVTAAVSISAPSTRFSGDRIHPVISKLKQTGETISRKLGYTSTLSHA